MWKIMSLSTHAPEISPNPSFQRGKSEPTRIISKEGCFNVRAKTHN